MNKTDILILGATTITLCLIFIPRRIKGMLPYFTALLVILLTIQYLLEGFYWQYIPTYLLICVLIMMVFFSKKNSPALYKTFVRIVLGLFILFSISPWAIFLPIPKLTKPEGYYTVGTRIFRWVDNYRAERITKDPADKRNVIVQAWYPTEPDAKGTHSRYLDGMDDPPAKIGVVPSFLFRHYDQIDTHGIMDAPISRVHKQWPVVIFLTGYGGTRAVYSSLSAGLASYGYVVLTIDHPYEAPIVELANGKIATTIEDFPKGYPDRTKFMKGRLDIRIADVQFVINQLGRQTSSPDNFFPTLDQSRIAIVGHSLGGASAAVAMAHDLRIKAAANIDGTLYDELPEPNGPRHFLLLESNKSESERFVRYENGNQRLFKQFGGGYRYEMAEADHYSFTDVPVFLALPTRFLAGRILKFGQIPRDTHTATVAMLNAFFNNALNGKTLNIDTVASCYQGVMRKPVNQ
jgi:dienelactone hydrolase